MLWVQKFRMNCQFDPFLCNRMVLAPLLIPSLGLALSLCLGVHASTWAMFPSDASEYSTGSVTAQTLLDDLDSKEEHRLLRAKNYMAGVMDLSEGVSWCGYALVKPLIVMSTLYEKLKIRPAADLQQRAARLIELELRSYRPCKSSAK